MTIAEAIRAAAHRLVTVSDTPRLDAEVLLRHVLGLDRTGLYLRLRDPLDPADEAAFTVLVERRTAREPVAYLTGEREFMGLPFVVRPGVLIPRPETELLVEWALVWLSNRPTASTTVVDVGTGSGAIALSLAAHLPADWAGTIVGIDVSATALAVAAVNRSRLGLSERVELVRGDLATWCRPGVDLLLANLPYLRPDQGTADLAAEPELALFSGRDGLNLVRRLLTDAPRLLASGGAIGLEIDSAQADAVRAGALAAFPAATVSIRQDLAGHDRLVVVETSGS